MYFILYLQHSCFVDSRQSIKKRKTITDLNENSTIDFCLLNVSSYNLLWVGVCLFCHVSTSLPTEINVVLTEKLT